MEYAKLIIGVAFILLQVYFAYVKHYKVSISFKHSLVTLS